VISWSGELVEFVFSRQFLSLQCQIAGGGGLPPPQTKNLNRIHIYHFREATKTSQNRAIKFNFSKNNSSIIIITVLSQGVAVELNSLDSLEAWLIPKQQLIF